MAIENIHNVGIAVSDLERAVDFYAKLGLRDDGRDPTPAATMVGGQARLWVFQTGSAAAASHRAADLVGNPPGFDHVSFWVGDVDAAAAGARANGLELESEPADQAWGYRAASLLDPDGNRVFLLGSLRG